MSIGCIQGSYIDLRVHRNATRVTIELKANPGSYAGLSEIEFYADGLEVYERYFYGTSPF